MRGGFTTKLGCSPKNCLFFVNIIIYKFFKKNHKMTTHKSANNQPKKEVISMKVVTNPDGTESYKSNTPDSYDAHITPAETAARKEREGNDFKHLDKQTEGSEQIDTAGGAVVDKEGLLNNFAVEPEMYYEKRGDIPREDSAVPPEQEHQE